MISGLGTLIAYTDWQRQYWIGFFQRNDAAALDIATGPGGDGRHETVRHAIRHIFSAEQRYIERMSDKPITDPLTIPSGSADALFTFGVQSRNAFRDYIANYPDVAADEPQELRLGNNSLTASPRKIVTHVLLHEIRHWAQIATLLRLNGYKVDLQDYIFMP
jgi:uncharacterized damage-inducible protein DinB